MSHSNCLCVIGVYTPHTRAAFGVFLSLGNERTACRCHSYCLALYPNKTANKYNRAHRERERETESNGKTTNEQYVGVWLLQHYVVTFFVYFHPLPTLCRDPQGSFEELFCHFLVVAMEGRKYDGPQLINNDIRCGIMDG